MWLMAKEKFESWWWIATNLSSIPLYFVKHVFTSVYYLVLLVMAIFGLMEWIRRENSRKHAF